jgi:energy-converting hydrogenase A subunit M
MAYTMASLKTIEQSAQRILDTQPDATVRIRLLRDVLRLPAQDDAMLNAQQDVTTKSRWVQELIQEQQGDGSWGRLHSRDSQAKARIVTTEVGVERALALGLDVTDPALRNAARYLANLLEGKANYLDRPERNDRWPTGVRLFAAATLARIQPDHAALDDVWNLGQHRISDIRFWQIRRRHANPGSSRTDRRFSREQLPGAQ